MRIRTRNTRIAAARAAVASIVVAGAILGTANAASAAPWTKYAQYESHGECYTVGSRGLAHRTWTGFQCTKALKWELWVTGF